MTRPSPAPVAAVSGIAAGTSFGLNHLVQTSVLAWVTLAGLALLVVALGLTLWCADVPSQP